MTLNSSHRALALAKRGDDFEFRGETALLKWLHIAMPRKVLDHGKHLKRQRRNAAKEMPIARKESKVRVRDMCRVAALGHA